VIALWMLYATVFGALLGCSALALDRLAAPRRAATRWWWAGAIAATLVAPAALALRHRTAAPVPAVIVTAAAPTTLGGASTPDAVGHAVRWPRLNLARLDAPLLAVWGVASGALLFVLVGAVVTQWRRVRAWPAHLLDGRPVLVAPEEGPLVWGWWRLTIVVPRWVLARSETEVRLMLAHEDEHRRARDPNLLLLGALATTLAPWNVALWWLARRLRLAIETDCDCRVLRTGADAHGYGTLLLEVGSRAGRPPVRAGAAFAETASLLERRLEAMTAAPPRRSLARVFALGTVAVISLAIACAAPQPAALRPAATSLDFPPLAAPRPSSEAFGQPYTREEMTAAIGRYFPEVLRGDTGVLPIRFIIGANGGVVTTSRGAANGPVVPPGRLLFARRETVGPGYYGPAPVRVEVLWLKPDSVADASAAYGFETTESAPRAPSDTGVTPEQLIPGLLKARPELLRGVAARDTAWVWFVMDRDDHVVRSGRSASDEAARRDARTSADGYWWPATPYRPGSVADGVVIVAVWWPRS